MSGLHRQTPVRHPLTGALVRVDEGMAELLWLCWGVGLTTTGSCQGEPYAAYIEFASPTAVERFLTLARLGLDSDHELVRRLPGLTHRNPDDPRNWRVQPWVKWTEEGASLRVYVRFPPDDLPVVPENARRWLANSVLGELGPRPPW